MGPRDRQTGGERHRVAVSPHFRSVPPTGRRGIRARHPADYRVGTRPLLLGDQDQVAPRLAPKRSANGGKRRVVLRHCRHMAASPPHRGRRPRHRRYECVSHDAAQSPRSPVGPRSHVALRHARGDAAGGAPICRLFRSHTPIRVRNGNTHHGRRGRSARRAIRPSLSRTGDGQDDLRHRRVRAVERRIVSCRYHRMGC